jgi:hypothetical protein
MELDSPRDPMLDQKKKQYPRSSSIQNKQVHHIADQC